MSLRKRKIVNLHVSADQTTETFKVSNFKKSQMNNWEYLRFCTQHNWNIPCLYVRNK